MQDQKEEKQNIQKNTAQFLKQRQKLRQRRKVYFQKQKLQKSLSKNVINEKEPCFEEFEKIIYNKKMRELYSKNFLIGIYKRVFYAFQLLKKPTLKKLEGKKISLTVKYPDKKLLLLDLDETIIYSKQNQSLEEGSQKLDISISFRPHLLKFLGNLKKYYNIFIFTSSLEKYCKKIVKLINKDDELIQGLLDRKHCLQTKNGIYLKDLRVIQNIPLKDIILVDNNVCSFSLQLDNGIPILDYTGNHQDSELFYLQKILIDLHEENDVRDGIKQVFNLERMGKIPVEKIEQYTKIKELKDIKNNNT